MFGIRVFFDKCRAGICACERERERERNSDFEFVKISEIGVFFSDEDEDGEELAGGDAGLAAAER